MPELSITTAADHGLAELATLFTRGFEDYVVPVQVTADALAARVRAESVDLGASRIVARAGEPVALALVARRGWTSRLAELIDACCARVGFERAALPQLEMTRAP